MLETRNHGEMTFDEIAAVLGVSPQRAQQIYLSGMRKLRRKRATLKFGFMLQMAREIEQSRLTRMEER